MEPLELLPVSPLAQQVTLLEPLAARTMTPRPGDVLVQCSQPHFQYEALDDDASKHRHVTPGEAFAAIQDAAKPPEWVELYAVFVLIVFLGTALISVSLFPYAIVGVLAAGVFVWTVHYKPRPSLVLYSVDDPGFVYRYALANATAQSLQSTQRWWDLEASSGHHGGQFHTSGVCAHSELSEHQTNLDPWCLRTARRQLFLLPDCILVRDARGRRVVPYLGLRVAWAHLDRQEQDSAPSDSPVLASTYLYTRKDGGRDLRYTHNPRIDTVRLGLLRLQASDGSQLALLTSHPDAAKRAAEALRELVAQAEGPAQAMATPSPRVEAPVVLVAAPKPLPGKPPPPPSPSLAAPRSAALPSTAPISDDRRPTEAPPAPLRAATSDEMPSWRAVAIVLKRLALSDRKFTADERVEIIRLLQDDFAEQLPHEPPLAALIEELCADEAAFAQAVTELTRAALSARQRVLRHCRAVALADGKVTPKETERIRQLAAALQVDALEVHRG